MNKKDHMKNQQTFRTASFLGLSALIAFTGMGADAQVINDSGIIYTVPTDIAATSVYGFDLANGFGRLAIASPELHDIWTGRVLVYDTTTGAELYTLVAPIDADEPGDFGRSIAMEGTNIVVATSAGDFAGTAAQDKDQVWVYDAVTGALRFELLPDNILNFNFGFGFDIEIDNGVIAVSQPAYDNFTGCVYLYDATDGSQIDVIYGEAVIGSTPFSLFGDEIEMHNGLLTVMQRDHPSVAEEQGIYIFDVVTRALLHEILPPVGNQWTDGWGTELAMNDDTLIVCAPGDDPYGLNTGSVFAYDLATGEFRNRIMVVNAPTESLIRMNAEINENGLVVVSSSNGEGAHAGSATVKLFESHTGIQVGSLEPSSGLRSASFGLAMTFINNEIFVSDINQGLSRLDTVTHYQTGSAITMHPQSHVTDVAGFGLEMQVLATNTTDFQWFKDGIEVADGPLYAGATTNLLSINSGSDTEGAYTCEVTSVLMSSVMSDPGYLVYQGATAPACPADFSGDGQLNFFDISIFLQAFGDGCP